VAAGKISRAVGSAVGSGSAVGCAAVGAGALVGRAAASVGGAAVGGATVDSATVDSATMGGVVAWAGGCVLWGAPQALNSSTAMHRSWVYRINLLRMLFSYRLPGSYRLNIWKAGLILELIYRPHQALASF
jgi:hypothetical protein